ncbi:TonB-dependent receptor [Terriglobus saanensis]|nr:carboxypeptidase regulatory-like domain-containing protein [Terriglobus saanensis]
MAFAQQACSNGAQVDGTITDPTGAVIPGAQVQTADGKKTITDAAGHFLLPCVRIDSNQITVEAEDFTSETVTVDKQVGGSIHLNIPLGIVHVNTVVQVDGDSSSTDRGSGTTTLNTKDVQLLADDPDDFLRQLQALSASSGGSPSSSVILIDGFQNGSVLPPKSSIASIRVNPDLFSAEYQTPPWSGGVIEIVTKPGADSLHGALFYSDSDSSFNATNPFSATPTPASRRRYGFELSGPVVSKKSGFTLALEKRDIDEFNIVNAVTLDGSGNQVPLRQTVSAPQRLWIASARGDWQVTSKDTAAFSFSSNVNNLGNQGVGGLTLAEAGYSGLLSEHDLRFTNTLIPNANLLHTTHVGYSWKRTKQSPLSTSPSLQVSGYFNGGGSIAQSLDNRERDLEVDDDLLIAHGKHQVKFGLQSLGIFGHSDNPNNFNGTYIFGGGSAPVLDANNNPTGLTTTISAIEQYRRAQVNLPGGRPTTYQVTSGSPLVPITQWRLGLYLQDNIKLSPRFAVNTGLRFALQTSPDSVSNFGPRASFSWIPDKKEKWVFRAQVGLFSELIDPTHALEGARLNDVRQKQVTIYSPNYNDLLTPVVGSIEVGTVQQLPQRLSQPLEYSSFFTVEHELPQHWNVRVNLYLGKVWNVLRNKNINAPMVKSSIGSAPDPSAALLAPRPTVTNKNILEYQDSGHFAGNVLAFVINQHSYKRFGLFAYYAYRNSWTNVSSGDGFPQSSYSDVGDSSRADWAHTHSFFLTGNINLPYGLTLSTEFDAQQGTPYNIITGTDNNGDGNFNDRPSYASAPGAGIYSTRFGLLTANAVNGDVPRNLGTMPATIHMDMNLSRSFSLSAADKAHSRTLTLNVRTANLLNHTNVTAVRTVLSSTLGQPLSAENSRRVELGARFAF